MGFVGAGNMGRGMAASLARAGHPVAQFDRDTAALAASAAASPLIEAVGSLEELCSRASTVVVSVAGEAAERSVFLEPGGLLEVAAPGSLLIDAGTVSVEFARELHAASAAAGVSFLDAPVSGGPEGAANGSLSIMVGGSEARTGQTTPTLRAAQPIPSRYHNSSHTTPPRSTPHPTVRKCRRPTSRRPGRPSTAWAATSCAWARRAPAPPPSSSIS